MRSLFFVFVLGVLSFGFLSFSVDANEEEGLLLGRINHFISPYEDMKWVGEQIDLLERLSATDGMSSEVAAGLLERCDILIRYADDVRYRVEKTTSLVNRLYDPFPSTLTKRASARLAKIDYLEIANQKRICYDFSFGDSSTPWIRLERYHRGLNDIDVLNVTKIIVTIESKGFCVSRDGTGRTKKYSRKDLPALEQEAKKRVRYVVAFGVPSVWLSLERLSMVQKRLFEKL